MVAEVDYDDDDGNDDDDEDDDDAMMMMMEGQIQAAGLQPCCKPGRSAFVV